MSLLNTITTITDAAAPTDVIGNLPDRPEIAASELKDDFDSGAAKVKDAVNAAIAEINANINVLNNLIVQTSGQGIDKVMSQKATTDAIAEMVISAGAGDMTKSVYDTDSDGKVDSAENADALGGKTLAELKSEIMLELYPVKSLKFSTENVNPGTYVGGTWELWGAGRVPVCVNTEDTAFDTPEKTGGEKTHTNTVDEMPNHGHAQVGQTVTGLAANNVRGDETTRYGSVIAGASSIMTTGGKGNNQPHNNLQPYITCYIWKRTA